MFNNKNIFILGMARSGYEAARVLSKNNNVIINDEKEEQDTLHIDELKSLGVNVVLGSHPDDLFKSDIDILVKNPGIKDSHKYVVSAKELGIPVINEVELAYELMPKDVTIIGVTGSNGKTTTTTLIYEMLKKEYNNIHLTGNIGFPLISFLDKIKPNDIVLMEVSVQQLLNTDKFKTNVSVVTNLSEAHLDHVDTYENYKNIKKKIFNQHNKSDISILNYDSKDVLEISKDIKSSKLYFSTKFKTDIYLEQNNIYYKNNFLINTSSIKLKGAHNYENIMAAILVCKIFNISNESIFKVLNEFNGVEHRIEFVKDINGRKIYNDSKSTNIVATKMALSSFDEPVILLLGGLNRRQSFLDLKEFKNIKHVVCYGENKEGIFNDMMSLNIKVDMLNNLEEATARAYELSDNKDVILLSPGSASWDQFKDFEERGTKFKEYIDKIV